MNERSQTVLEALWKLSKDGARDIRPGKLLDRLREHTGLPDLELGLALGELRDEGNRPDDCFLRSPAFV